MFHSVTVFDLQWCIGTFNVDKFWGFLKQTKQ